MSSSRTEVFVCRSYGVLIWELVSGQDITEMQPLAIARQMQVSLSSLRSPPLDPHSVACNPLQANQTSLLHIPCAMLKTTALL